MTVQVMNKWGVIWRHLSYQVRNIGEILDILETNTYRLCQTP